MVEFFKCSFCKTLEITVFLMLHIIHLREGKANFIRKCISYSRETSYFWFLNSFWSAFYWDMLYDHINEYWSAWLPYIFRTTHKTHNAMSRGRSEGRKVGRKGERCRVVWPRWVLFLYCPMGLDWACSYFQRMPVVDASSCSQGLHCPLPSCPVWWV